MQRREREIRNIVDPDIGKAGIAMKGRDDDVTVARQRGERHDIVVGQRAAGETVREKQNRPSRTRIRPDRRLCAALHMRHAEACRQRIVRARISRIGRIADDQRVRYLLRGSVGEQFAVVGDRDIEQ